MKKVLLVSTLVAAAATSLLGCRALNEGEIINQEPPGAGVVAVTSSDVQYSAIPNPAATANSSALQCYGGFSTLTFDELPIFGDDGSGGQEMKYGVVSDPMSAAASAYYFAARPTDPDTAGTGAKRCEHAYRTAPSLLPWDVPFWFGTRVMTRDLSTTTDQQAIWQWHDGSTISGLNPILAAFVTGGQLSIVLRYNYNANVSPATTTSITLYQGKWTPNAWVAFDVEAKIAKASPRSGFVKIWMNGRQIVNYSGQVGYNYSPNGDYAKLGLYHWTGGNAWDMRIPKRELWSKGSVLVLHRTGYTWQSIDALLSN